MIETKSKSEYPYASADATITRFSPCDSLADLECIGHGAAVAATVVDEFSWFLD